ncbi:Ion-translocating oxidoreductase complex subunit B [subsurface metagenome]
MCLLCERYSGGYERWYLNPANYARRLYKIRKGEAEELGAEANPQLAGGMGILGKEFLEAEERGDIETVKRLAQEAEASALGVHFGQVITLDEALKILDIMYPIALMSCACRRSMYGTPDHENFFCIGMGPGMYKWERWPDTYRGGVQYLTPDEAKEVVAKMDKKGLVHTVYTFGTPYLGGLCHCDYPDCAGLRMRLEHGVNIFWKGHCVARVDPELCNGCGQCVVRCQFKALNFSPTRNRAFIDQSQCFGCGLCATECPQDAITLVEKANLPALASAW